MLIHQPNKETEHQKRDNIVEGMHAYNNMIRAVYVYHMMRLQRSKRQRQNETYAVQVASTDGIRMRISSPSVGSLFLNVMEEGDRSVKRGGLPEGDGLGGRSHNCFFCGRLVVS
jgi:hypothetical protein